MYKEKLIDFLGKIYVENKISQRSYHSILHVLNEMNDLQAYIFIQEKKNWIAGAIEKPGSLHRALGVPQGEKIPKSKLKVKETDSDKMKKRKILAQTLGKMHKK